MPPAGRRQDKHELARSPERPRLSAVAQDGMVARADDHQSASAFGASRDLILHGPRVAQVKAEDGVGGREGRDALVSFNAWYRQEHPRLVATLLLLTGDMALAADAVDEAFARALERWERVSAMTSPTGWTLQVARNVCRRALRRAAIERRLLLRATHPTNVPPPAGEVWQLVAGLPQRQREVAVLRYVLDLREEEIAGILGVTRSTVSTTLRAAHDRLARALYEPPEGDDHA